jgi:hypothetical protein
VQRQWGCKFASETVAELTISEICDKFENDGTVKDAYAQQSGKSYSSTSWENSALHLTDFYH